MEGRRLILNDGTVIENGEAGYASGFLWLYFRGYTIAQASVLFCDPNVTERIVFQYGDMEDVYEGYTECMVIKIDADGRNAVCLTKGDE